MTNKNAVLVLLVVTIGSITSSHAQVLKKRFEVGQQYTFFYQDYGSVRNNLLGGRFDVRLSRRIWLTSQVDSGLTHYPELWVSNSGFIRNPTSAFGGRFLMGSWGLKVGQQRRRIGLFSEIRGGFATWSNALTYIDDPNATYQFGRVTQPLLNLSGTLEIYARSGLGFRMNAGSSRLFYPSRSIVVNEPPDPAFARSNVHISTGFFVQF